MMKYFRYKEFDSPDLAGSGRRMMNKEFLSFIDSLRGRCKFPFVVSSGFRTHEYNNSLIESPVASDISIRDSYRRALFIGNAIELSSELDLPIRLGISKTFCHIDIDTAKGKNSPRIWVY